MLPKPFLSPLTKKLLLIVGLTVGLNIPLSKVEVQVVGRHEFESIAQKEVAKSWGTSANFYSPKIKTQQRDFSPITSQTTIHVSSQEKTRGWFQIPVYTATYKAKVYFQKEPIPTKLPDKPEPDYFIVPVIPLESLQNFKIKDVSTGKTLEGKVSSDGIRVEAKQIENGSFFERELEVEISMRGTGPIVYQSTVERDEVQMKGNWTKPKFSDEFLPEKTNVSEYGFEATWVLSSLPKWQDVSVEPKVIGFQHLWIGSDYAKVERAIKYGILFVALTFLLIFLIEFKADVRVHPLQYGLIGLAISIFYLLLLALSEMIGFDMAYLISTLAVTGLIGFYIQGFLKHSKFVGLILFEQILLSSFFYLLLSLEDVAFLIGSLGLFAALATFMTMTRRMDWYASGQNKSTAQT